MECDAIEYKKDGEPVAVEGKVKPLATFAEELSSSHRIKSSGREYALETSSWEYQVRLTFQNYEIDSQGIIDQFRAIPRLKLVDTIYRILLTRITYEHPTAQNRSRGTTVVLFITINPLNS